MYTSWPQLAESFTVVQEELLRHMNPAWMNQQKVPFKPPFIHKFGEPAPHPRNSVTVVPRGMRPPGAAGGKKK